MTKNIRIIIIVVALIVAGISGYNIVSNYLEMHRGDTAYENIRDEVIIEPSETADEPQQKNYDCIDVNFDMLENINTDIVAWLYIHDTPVSYPVLHGTDNQAYLRTTYDRKSNILGSIFEDYRNDPNLKDTNTIIYGHNTTNDSMFGSLKKYKDQTFADNHPNICVLKKEGLYVYEIFSVYETLATSNTYTIRFSSEETFAEYINEMAAKTVVSAADPPEASEQILTLSTCTGGNKAMRLVLQAKYIDFVPAEDKQTPIL